MKTLAIIDTLEGTTERVDIRTQSYLEVAAERQITQLKELDHILFEKQITRLENLLKDLNK